MLDHSKAPQTLEMLALQSILRTGVLSLYRPWSIVCSVRYEMELQTIESAEAQLISGVRTSEFAYM